MTKPEIFASIEKLIPILNQFHTTGTGNISMDDKLILKRTFEFLYKTTANVSCSSCCLQMMNYLLTWYEREKPLYDEQMKALETVEPPKETVSCCKKKQPSTKKKTPSTKKNK